MNFPKLKSFRLFDREREKKKWLTKNGYFSFLFSYQKESLGILTFILGEGFEIKKRWTFGTLFATL